MKARMELVVGASAARQRATSRLECRQRAHSLLSCQTWTGFYQHQFLLLSKWFKIYLFAYQVIKTFGINTPPPCWKRRRSNTYLNDIALSTMWFISPGNGRFTTQLYTRHPLLRFETVPKHWSQFFHRKLKSEFKSALPLAMHEISVSTNFLVFCKFGRSFIPLKTCNLHCMSADHKNNEIKKELISYLILIFRE